MDYVFLCILLFFPLIGWGLRLLNNRLLEEISGLKEDIKALPNPCLPITPTRQDKEVDVSEVVVSCRILKRPYEISKGDVLEMKKRLAKELGSEIIKTGLVEEEVLVRDCGVGIDESTFRMSVKIIPPINIP